MNTNTTLQVVCKPSDWLASSIQAVNVLNAENRPYSPVYTRLTANELPPKLLATFNSIVEQFKVIGSFNGDPKWFASSVHCERQKLKERYWIETIYEQDDKGNLVLDKDGNPIIISETPKMEVIQKDAVVMSVKLNMIDGTISSFSQVNENKDVIELFDTLTTEAFWLKNK